MRVIRDLGKMGLLGKVSFYDVTKNRKVTRPAEEFITFQDPKSDPSPPFAEYTSGHSGFSATAAQVLKLWTGSDCFGVNIVLKAKSLKDITISFKTFSQAADNATVLQIFQFFAAQLLYHFKVLSRFF